MLVGNYGIVISGKNIQDKKNANGPCQHFKEKGYTAYLGQCVYRGDFYN